MDETEKALELAEAVAEGMYELDSAARAHGVTIDEVRPEYARMRMTVTESMLNSHRICHGGMLFLLADCAFAYACNAANKASVALSCVINFADAVQLGEELVAVAEKNFRHARTGAYDVTVYAGDDRKVAIFRGNSYQISGEAVPGLNARMGFKDDEKS